MPPITLRSILVGIGEGIIFLAFLIVLCAGLYVLAPIIQELRK